MKSAIGKGMTREDHPEVSNQVKLLSFLLKNYFSYMLIMLLVKIPLP